MADTFPTPVLDTSGVMHGIEINANILAGLLDHKSINIARPLQPALFTIVPALIVRYRATCCGCRASRC